MRVGRGIAAGLALLLGAALAGEAPAEPRLLMIEQTYCEYCEAWDAEVGVVFDKTTEGRAAPLERHNIAEPLPEDVTLSRRVHYTPTFVLLCDGNESGRIEGYPGEEFFYGLLRRLYERAGVGQAGGAC